MATLRNFVSSNFAVIQSGLITDNRLSHGAFRVACYIQSLPEGSKPCNEDIKAKLNIKTDKALNGCLQELVSAGYLK